MHGQSEAEAYIFCFYLLNPARVGDQARVITASYRPRLWLRLD